MMLIGAVATLPVVLAMGYFLVLIGQQSFHALDKATKINRYTAIELGGNLMGAMNHSGVPVPDLTNIDGTTFTRADAITAFGALTGTLHAAGLPVPDMSYLDGTQTDEEVRKA